MILDRANEATRFSDQALIDEVALGYDTLGEDRFGRYLQKLAVGGTSLWDVFRYPIMEAMLRQHPSAADDEARAHLEWASGRQRGETWLGAIRRSVWQAQLDAQFVEKVLEHRLGPIGDVLEQMERKALARGAAEGRPTDVLVAGCTTCATPLDLRVALQRLGRDLGYRVDIIVQDDPTMRHGRAMRSAGMDATPLFRFGLDVEMSRARSLAEAAARAPAPQLPWNVRFFQTQHRRVRRAVMHALVCGRILDTYRPRLLIVPDERKPVARAMAVEARRRRIHTISTPVFADQITQRMPPAGGLAAHRMLVASELVAERMSSGGVDARLFTPVGRPNTRPTDPRLLTRRARDELRVTLGVAADAFVVLFASQALAVNRFLLPMVKSSVARMPNATLLVRPHPRESAFALRLSHSPVRVSRLLSAAEAVRACDVLVTHSSTVAFDAIVLGVPVILFSLERFPALATVSVAAGVRHARSVDELHSSLVAARSAPPPEPIACQRDSNDHTDAVVRAARAALEGS